MTTLDRAIHRVLAIRSPDRLLHQIAPLGLAASIAPCLVIDLDHQAPPMAPRTLADLLRDGVRAADLSVPASGVGVVGNGGVGYDDVGDLVDRLGERWPTVVLRVGTELDRFPTAEVEPMLPGPLAPTHPSSVLQQTLRGQRVEGERCVLPPLRRAQIDAMLSGRIEPRWRWVRSWRPVWSRSWA